jgi:hypothetical protein
MSVYFKHHKTYWDLEEKLHAFLISATHDVQDLRKLASCIYNKTPLIAVTTDEKE